MKGKVSGRQSALGQSAGGLRAIRFQPRFAPMATSRHTPVRQSRRQHARKSQARSAASRRTERGKWRRVGARCVGSTAGGLHGRGRGTAGTCREGGVHAGGVGGVVAAVDDQPQLAVEAVVLGELDGGVGVEDARRRGRRRPAAPAGRAATGGRSRGSCRAGVDEDDVGLAAQGRQLAGEAVEGFGVERRPPAVLAPARRRMPSAAAASTSTRGACRRARRRACRAVWRRTRRRAPGAARLASTSDDLLAEAGELARDSRKRAS